MRLVAHLLQLFLDAIESDGDILGRDAHHLPYLLVAHVLKPEQDNGTVEGPRRKIRLRSICTCRVSSSLSAKRLMSIVSGTLFR